MAGEAGSHQKAQHGSQFLAGQRGSESGEGFVRVPLARYQFALAILDIRDAAKTIHLQFIEKVGMAERHSEASRIDGRDTQQHPKLIAVGLEAVKSRLRPRIADQQDRPKHHPRDGPELRHCIDALPTCRASGNHDAPTTLGHARRLVYKRVERVPPNLSLQCAQ